MNKFLLENQIQGPKDYHRWRYYHHYFEESIHCFFAWHIFNCHYTEYYLIESIEDGVARNGPVDQYYHLECYDPVGDERKNILHKMETLITKNKECNYNVILGIRLFKWCK